MDRGEPAQGARDVESIENVLAAMALQLEEEGVAPRPLAERSQDGRDQDLRHACPVGARHLLQQRPWRDCTRQEQGVAVFQVHRQRLDGVRGRPPVGDLALQVAGGGELL